MQKRDARFCGRHSLGWPTELLTRELGNGQFWEPLVLLLRSSLAFNATRMVRFTYRDPVVTYKTITSLLNAKYITAKVFHILWDFKNCRQYLKIQKHLSVCSHFVFAATKAKVLALSDKRTLERPLPTVKRDRTLSEKLQNAFVANYTSLRYMKCIVHEMSPVSKLHNFFKSLLYFWSSGNFHCFNENNIL